jgi:hypothetical protein
LNPKPESRTEDNGKKRAFSLVRAWSLLVVGLGLVVYSLVVDAPATLTAGIGLVGLNPVVHAAL